MFTKFELEVLETLWQEKRPLSRSEIVKFSPNQILKLNSMPYILKKLQEKGAVEQSGAKKELYHYSGQYVATITREEYVADHLLNEMPELNFAGVFSAMTGKKQVSKQALEELREMIEALEKTAGDA